MADSIIGEVAKEIKELGKDTAREVVKQTADTGAEFFKSLIGASELPSLSPEEREKLVKDKEAEKQKNLAQVRKQLRKQLLPREKREESAFERARREEIWRKQRTTELAEQRQKETLYQPTPHPRRGDIRQLTHRARRQRQVEIGKIPGQ